MRKTIFILIAFILLAVSIDWIHSCADLKSHKEEFGRHLTYAEMYEYKDKDYDYVVRVPSFFNAQPDSLQEEKGRMRFDYARVEYVMASVVKQLMEMVLNGHKVELGELGLIGLACHGTGSATEEEVTVKNNVKGLNFTFRPSVELKEELLTVKKELIVLDYGGSRKQDEHGALLIESRKE